MRRFLALAALSAAATLGSAPAPSSAYVCAVWVGDLCVGPCGVANLAYRTATGGDLLNC